MKFIKTILLTIILTAAFSAFSFAQDDPIRVETNLVTLNVAVTDKSGKYVKNLKREDFEVWDNRTKQPIDTFSAEDVPVSFGIVYDMHPTTDERTKTVLDALRQFTKDFKQKDNFFVTVFNERGSLTTEFVPNAEQINANLSDAKPSTPNSLYDAIFAASEKVREQRNTKQVLIVLTDGEDNASHHSLKELRMHLRSVNLPVYSVSFGSDNRRYLGYYDIYRNQGRQTLGASETSQLSTAALDEISKSSGGQTFERAVQNRFLLYGVFKKVHAEVENQYVVGFYPDVTDGKWHKLKIKVKAAAGKKYKLSNRKGYLSPKAK
ncbi:MAG TPA: VWA domain-containing protein [Pyrinomonadaceae bacterium]|nr:VWA domain-containing protein [Pyrinomonadaceae bacterium]